jgi:hypothetical protein
MFDELAFVWECCWSRFVFLVRPASWARRQSVLSSQRYSGAVRSRDLPSDLEARNEGSLTTGIAMRMLTLQCILVQAWSVAGKCWGWTQPRFKAE